MNFQVYEGVALQTRKHYQSHGNGISATLHEEFWLRFDDGREDRVHLTDVDLPIRVSHRIALVYLDGWLAAVINRTTDRYVAFPPTMPAVSAWRQFFTLFVPALAAIPIFLVFLIGLLIVWPSPPGFVIALLTIPTLATAMIGVGWLEKPLLRKVQHNRDQLNSFHNKIAELSARRNLG